VTPLTPFTSCTLMCNINRSKSLLYLEDLQVWTPWLLNEVFLTKKWKQPGQTQSKETGSKLQMKSRGTRNKLHINQAMFDSKAKEPFNDLRLIIKETQFWNPLVTLCIIVQVTDHTTSLPMNKWLNFQNPRYYTIYYITFIIIVVCKEHHTLPTKTFFHPCFNLFSKYTHFIVQHLI